MTSINMSKFASKFDGIELDAFLMMNDTKLKTMDIQMLQRRTIISAIVTYKMNKGLIH